MPDVIAQVTIHTGQGVFPPGSVVTVETESEAAAIIAAGNATAAKDGGDGGEAGGSDLPEDIPGRAALVKAGLTFDQVVDLMQKGTILDVPGIGPAKVDELAAWFEDGESE